MTESRPRRWSWQLGKLFGISIRVHVTLGALLVWIAIAAPLGGARPAQVVAQWVLLVAAFASIVIHELSHALVARRFGCATREILLLPIGGIAQVERTPQRPAQELLMALAGPAANIVIAAALGAVIAIAGWPLHPEQPTLLGALTVSVFWINVTLAAFNLLPAFPMDGGRVLRAVLAARLGRPRATRIAGVVGKVSAAVFVIAGLTVGGTMLAIIGVFVWFAAARESATVALSSLLSEATVADAMIRAPLVVDAAAAIDGVAERMLAEGHRELVVSDGGRVAGVVTAADVAVRMAMPQPHGVVGGVMHRAVPVVAPTAPLDTVLEPLEQNGVLLVGEQDLVIGLLTAEQLATYTALRPPKRAS